MKNMLKMKEEKPENGEWMFRVESHYWNKSVTLKYEEYKIISRTLRGCWIVPEFLDGLFTDDDLLKHKKFVLYKAKKRYAYETREQAMCSFRYRKRRQIEILRLQLRNAELSYTEAGGVLPLPTRCATWFNEYDY